MGARQGSKKLWLRSVATVIVITFTVTTIAWADGQGGIISSLPSKIKSIPSASKDTTPDVPLTIETLQIPTEWGVVKSSFQGSPDQLVIHIQDAHVNEEAQRNIAHLIRYLNKTKDASLVAIEGAVGKLDTALFAAFPDDGARKAVADYFLAEGVLTGPELLAVTDSPRLVLFGAEEKETYDDNRRAFLNSLEFNGRSARSLGEIRGGLDQISRFVFSEELRKLREEERGFQLEKGYLTHYVRYLVGLADRLNVSRYAYRQIESFLDLIELERKINFEQAE